jgi:hypothetical protein
VADGKGLDLEALFEVHARAGVPGDEPDVATLHEAPPRLVVREEGADSWGRVHDYTLCVARLLPELEQAGDVPHVRVRQQDRRGKRRQHPDLVRKGGGRVDEVGPLPDEAETRGIKGRGTLSFAARAAARGVRDARVLGDPQHAGVDLHRYPKRAATASQSTTFHHAAT